MRKTKLCVIVLSILLTACLSSCGDDRMIGPDTPNSIPVDQIENLSSFYYFYSNPFGECSYSYDITKDESGDFILKYEAMAFPENIVSESVLADETIDELLNVMNAYALSSWDGFDEVDSEVMDGDGFDMCVEYAEDKVISASGSNATPERYWDFKEEMDKLLKPVSE